MKDLEARLKALEKDGADAPTYLDTDGTRYILRDGARYFITVPAGEPLNGKDVRYHATFVDAMDEDRDAELARVRALKRIR